MPDEADDTPAAQQRSLVGQVADCFVYAPLGLAFDARDLFPSLVEKGRNQVMIAKMLGRFAVQQGTQVGRSTVVDLGTQAVSLLPGVDLASTPAPTDDGDGSTTSTTDAASDPVEDPESTLSAVSTPAADEQGFVPIDGAEASSAAPPVDVATLAIPDYDSLSALQVVPRLDGLTTAELAAVGAYEAATRGRKTILNKVAQLQSS